MSTASYDAVRAEPVASRDLACLDLWERSLNRSQQRRRLAELGRRTQRRRKSVSFALSAALAAGPVLPRAVGAAEPQGSATTGDADATGSSSVQSSSQRLLLALGDTGTLVTAVQQRLDQVVPSVQLAEDGIYGPLTREGVLEFQRSHGLAPTGYVDAQLWALLFQAPVLTLGPAASGAGTSADESTAGTGAASAGSELTTEATPSTASAPATTTTRATAARASSAATDQHPTVAAPVRKATVRKLAVIAPPKPKAQSVTYVMVNGVALPLPREYLVNGSVDQGVDYAAPGGTPLYAMGDGVIIGEGIDGFGPNAPIVEITSGPLKGMEVYYGHSGPDLVSVGQHVSAGQQISEVGYGIVGISTGPHLEVGFYPPGPMGAGSQMLSEITSLLNAHASGRTFATMRRASVDLASSGTSIRPTSPPSGQTTAASSVPAASAAAVSSTQSSTESVPVASTSAVSSPSAQDEAAAPSTGVSGAAGATSTGSDAAATAATGPGAAASGPGSTSTSSPTAAIGSDSAATGSGSPVSGAATSPGGNPAAGSAGAAESTGTATSPPPSAAVSSTPGGSSATDADATSTATGSTGSPGAPEAGPSSSGGNAGSGPDAASPASSPAGGSPGAADAAASNSDSSTGADVSDSAGPSQSDGTSSGDVGSSTSGSSNGDATAGNGSSVDSSQSGPAASDPASSATSGSGPGAGTPISGKASPSN